ncbi:hypothetical protein UT300007_22290 [Clostridium sp. CTA-7]
MNNKRNIYLMNLIVFLQGFVFYAPIATIFREARGISLSQIFLIESISMILIILFEIPWGVFADKFGYKKTLVMSNLIFFISKIIFFKAHSFWMFLFERILLSISISGLSGCDSALIYLSINKGDNSERIFARYGWFSTIGFLLSSVMSTFIINISIDSAAYYTIIPYGLAFLASLFLKDIKSEIKERENIKESFKIVLNNKNIIVFIFSLALITEVVQSVTVFLDQGQYIKSGIDIKYFGILLVIIQIMRLISVKSYKLSNKLGQNKSINFLMGLIFLACLFLIFIDSPIGSVLCIGIAATSMALIEPMGVDIKNKSISSENRATILSIYSMLGSIISAVINPIIGFASNSSLENGLIICSLISLVSIILMRYFIRVSKEKVN